MPAELLEGALPFSDALASSVLPVNLHKQKHKNITLSITWPSACLSAATGLALGGIENQPTLSKLGFQA